MERNPTQEQNSTDPGDATGRNFRYQYSYGVILLVAGALRLREYRAIWCEQFEDFLCELNDDRGFDAIQVKTQQPEIGYWQTDDEAFVQSIKRFVTLDKEFPSAIRKFVFVSNTAFLDSDAKTQSWKSPRHLVRAVEAATNGSELTDNAKRAFEKLLKDCGAEEQALFRVLGRLELVRGPSREGFIAEIAQNHVGKLKSFSGLTGTQLNAVTEELISLVQRASTLASQAPERHVTPLDRSAAVDPQLRAKRISVEDALHVGRSKICELKTSKTSRWWCLLAGPVLYLMARIGLPSIHWEQALVQPVPLGEVSHVAVSYYVGDVAIPNRLEPADSSGTHFKLSPRHKYWDAYLITAPVPQIFSTTQGVNLSVPWTLLPQSVCSSVAQLDQPFASELESWLQLKESQAQWHFDRLLRKATVSTNDYYIATGIEAIYAVNLFDFLHELGDDYHGSLARAISSASKEVVERTGSDNHRKVAFPALAAAQHVKDREIVLTYARSFSSVLDGIRRAEGRKPAEIVLII